METKFYSGDEANAKTLKHGGIEEAEVTWIHCA
jgi:hypothetical protein